MTEAERLQLLEQLRDAAERAYSIAVRSYAEANLDASVLGELDRLEAVCVDAGRAYAAADLEARDRVRACAAAADLFGARAAAEAALDTRDRASVELEKAYGELERAYACAELDARDRITRTKIERDALRAVRATLDAVVIGSPRVADAGGVARISRARAAAAAAARVARTRIGVDAAIEHTLYGPAA